MAEHRRREFDIEEHFLRRNKEEVVRSSAGPKPSKSNRERTRFSKPGDPTQSRLWSTFHPSESSVWGNAMYNELKKQLKRFGIKKINTSEAPDLSLTQEGDGRKPSLVLSEEELKYSRALYIRERVITHIDTLRSITTKLPTSIREPHWTRIGGNITGQWNKDAETTKKYDPTIKIRNLKAKCSIEVWRTELCLSITHWYAGETYWIFTIDQEEVVVDDEQDGVDEKTLEVTHIEFWVNETADALKKTPKGWTCLVSRPEDDEQKKKPTYPVSLPESPEWIEEGKKRVQQIRDRQLKKKELKRERKEGWKNATLQMKKERE